MRRLLPLLLPALILAPAGCSASTSPSQPSSSPAASRAPKTLATRWVTKMSPPLAAVQAGSSILVSTTEGLTALSPSGEKVWTISVSDATGHSGALLPLIVGDVAYVSVDAGHNSVSVGAVEIPADSVAVLEIDISTGAVRSHSNAAWLANNHDGGPAAGTPSAASKSVIVFTSGFHSLPVFYDVNQKTVTTITQRDQIGCGDGNWAALSPYQLRGRRIVSVDQLPEGEPTGWLTCREGGASSSAHSITRALQFDSHSAPTTAGSTITCGQKSCLALSGGDSAPNARLLSSADLKPIGQPVPISGSQRAATLVGADDWIVSTEAQTTAITSAGTKSWSAPIGSPEGFGILNARDNDTPYPIFASTASGGTVTWLGVKDGTKVKELSAGAGPTVVSYLGGDTICLMTPKEVQIATSAGVVARGPALDDPEYPTRAIAWSLGSGSYLLATDPGPSGQATVALYKTG